MNRPPSGNESLPPSPGGREPGIPPIGAPEGTHAPSEADDTAHQLDVAPGKVAFSGVRSFMRSGKDKVGQAATAAGEIVGQAATAAGEKVRETAASAGSAAIERAEDELEGRKQISKSVRQSMGSTQGTSKRQRRLMERKARKRDTRIAAVLERDESDSLNSLSAHQNNSGRRSLDRSASHSVRQGKMIGRIDRKNEATENGKDPMGRVLGGVVKAGQKIGGESRAAGPKRLDTLGPAPKTPTGEKMKGRYERFDIESDDRFRFDSARTIRLRFLATDFEERMGRKPTDAESERFEDEASVYAKTYIEDKKEWKQAGNESVAKVQQVHAETQRIYNDSLHKARLAFMQKYPSASDIPEATKQTLIQQAREEAEQQVYHP